MRSNSSQKIVRFFFFLTIFFLSSCQQREVSSSSQYFVRKAPSQRIAQEPTPVTKAPTEKPTPPPAPTPTKSAPSEKARFVVCLDAGHGGYQTGTKRKKNPLLCEKQLSLDLALQVQKMLLPMGYSVVLTRRNDTFVSLPDRVLLAEKKKAILFVSLHYNWAKNSACRGVEVFYFDKKNDLRSALSKKAASILLRAITEKTPLPSRGIKHGNFYVVRDTTIPAVLIESGFFSNRDDVLFLKQKVNRKVLAEAIAKGIHEFCMLEK